MCVSKLSISGVFKFRSSFNAPMASRAVEWCKRTAVPRTALGKTTLFAGTSLACLGGAAASIYGYNKLLDACDRSKRVEIGCNLASISGGGIATAFLGYGTYDILKTEVSASKNICQFMGRSSLVSVGVVSTMVPLTITVLAAHALKENMSSSINNTNHAYRPPPC